MAKHAYSKATGAYLGPVVGEGILTYTIETGDGKLMPVVRDGVYIHVPTPQRFREDSELPTERQERIDSGYEKEEHRS